MKARSPRSRFRFSLQPIRQAVTSVLVGFGLLAAFSVPVHSQISGQSGWTWESGNPVGGQSGVYGQIGTAASGNVPGARYGAAGWTDTQGNLWLFGGGGLDSTGTDGLLNDLWDFNPATSQWTWMGGSKSISCPPSSHQSSCPVSGVYGSLGKAAAQNVPGGRFAMASWTDKQGNLWLFGGSGIDSAGNGGELNDLWEFNRSTKQWTWITGSSKMTTLGGNGYGQVGVYGSLGKAAAGNTPGSRMGAASWTDSGGNLWLFGGVGFDQKGNLGNLNDLWEFNPATSEWTWMGGANIIPCNGNCGEPGVYGTLGTPSAGNIPGARQGARAWADGAGNFWLYGGYGTDANSHSGYLTDIWQFSPSTDEWTWVGGSSSTGTAALEDPVWGTLGAFASTNTPGGRDVSAGWVDGGGYVWLFGGHTNISNVVDDLWEYNPDLNEWVWMGGPDQVVCLYNGGVQYCGYPGVFYGTVGELSALNQPGGRGWATTWTDSQGNFWLFGGSGYDAGLGPNSHGVTPLNDLWKYQHTSAAVAPTFRPTPGGYSSPQSVTLSDANADATIYYTTDGSTPTTGSKVYTGPIPVAKTETLEAIAEAPGLAPSAVSTGAYVIAWATTTTLTASQTSSVFMQLVTLTATVTSPNGTPPDGTGVQLADGTTVWQTMPLKNGKATFLTQNTPGTYHLTAVFTGTTNYIASTSNVVTEKVTEGSSATTLTISPNPAPFGSVVTLTGTASSSTGGLPIGEIVFNNGSAQLGVAFTTPPSASVSMSLTSAPLGTNSITASFLDSGQYFASKSAPVKLVITPQVTAGFDWTWMGGPSIWAYSTQGGIYGTEGTPGIGNIPGNRIHAATWSDRQGNLWLFGGSGYALLQSAPQYVGAYGWLNDLWKYTPSTNLWTWVRGSNEPCVLELPLPSTACTGPLHVNYGPIGHFDPSYDPGPRESAGNWTDSKGNFWIFGGIGTLNAPNAGFSSMNDLWEYQISSGEWAWMGGTQQYELPGTYGRLSVPAKGNLPGARYGMSTWADTQGNLWLFGGYGPDIVPHSGNMNDLWEFSPSANQWTWVSGNDALVPTPIPGENMSYFNVPGNYGKLGVAAATNVPGGRQYAAHWTDKNGNFWLFGGLGTGTPNTFWSMLNDMWEFNPATREWIWWGGAGVTSYNSGYPNVCGTLGVASAANAPGSRYDAMYWTDASGNLWLFGGMGLFGQNINGYLNDLWEFNPSTKQWAWMGGGCVIDDSPDPSGWYGFPGVYGTVGIPSALDTPGGRSGGAAWTDAKGNAWLFAGVGFDTYGNSSTHDNLPQYENDFWMYQPFANAAAPAATAVTVAVSSKTSVYNQAVALGASVTTKGGVPPNGEAAEFFSGGLGLGIGTLTGGKASVTTTAIPAGSNSIYAVYGGDPTLAGSDSAPVNLTVNKAATTTSILVSPLTLTLDDYLSVSTTVSGQYGGTPTGTITIYNGKTALRTEALVDGTDQTSMSNMPLGKASISVAYSGDSNYSPSVSSTVSVTVNKAPTMPEISSSINPSKKGQPVTFTVFVHGYFQANTPPTGKVTLLNGTTTVGTATLVSSEVGTVKIAASALPAGNDSLTAVYAGDANFATSTSPTFHQVVNQ